MVNAQHSSVHGPGILDYNTFHSKGRGQRLQIRIAEGRQLKYPIDSTIGVNR
jgi:hypothetical protein